MRKLSAGGALLAISISTATGCVGVLAYPPVAACTPHREDRVALALSTLGASEVDRVFRDCPADGLEELKDVLKGSNERKRQKLLAQAEDGDAQAQHRLAMLHYPVGPAQAWPSPDVRMDAWNWLCRSAGQGYAPSEYKLAKLYWEGFPPTKPNYVNAYVLLSRAASHGETRALLLRKKLVEQMSVRELGEAQRLLLERQPLLDECDGEKISATEM